MSDLTIYSRGGTVQPRSGGLYIQRKADSELLALCRKGEYAHVLTTRQVGKSSLMVSTAQRLAAEGVATVTIDLNYYGKATSDDRWYQGILTTITGELKFEFNVPDWWQSHDHLVAAQRLELFFREILLVKIDTPVVIFIDEIEVTRGLRFKDDFFALIRSLYNARAQVPEFDRLTFVLIGTAMPGELIDDPDRTPFNIGQRVELTDFTTEEMAPLAAGLGLPPNMGRQVMQWVRTWTGGHPYLTQCLCYELAHQPRSNWSKEEVDAIVANFFLEQDIKSNSNLQWVHRQLTRGARNPATVLKLYQQILQRRPPIRDDESDTKAYLKICGVVRPNQEGLLVPRNQIYAKVFGLHWVKEQLSALDLLAPELEDTLCPYRGLDPFQPSDQRQFFGRQWLIDELLNRLKEGDRLLAIVGPWGSGKSSLVLAGLAPALQAGGVNGSKEWHYYPAIVPGSNPLKSLVHLTRPADTELEGWEQEHVERLQHDSDHLRAQINAMVDRPCLLIVDQFEEIFTLCHDEAIRQAFVDNLLRLVQTPDDGHVVVLTMRTDFERDISLLPTLQPPFEKARMSVMPPSAGELREAIERPAAAVGLVFEDDIVDALIQDVLNEPSGLLLLQFTLLKLWDNRERNKITWNAYRRLGGVRVALARSADEFYEGLIVEEQITTKRILLRMVSPGIAQELTVKPVRREELYRFGEAHERIDRVLEKLVQSRLVRILRRDSPNDDQFEIAHEALVRNWPRFVDWLNEERERLALRQRLETKTAEWIVRGRGNSGLLDTIGLQEAEHWLASRDAFELGYDEALPALVKASQTAQTRRKLRVGGSIVFALLVIFGVALWALSQNQLAQQKSAAAETAQALQIAERAARSTAEAERAQAIGVADQLATEVVVRSTAEAYAHLAKEAAEGEVMLRITAEVAARHAQDIAEQQAQIAQSRELAAASITNLASDPELSLLLASYAISTTLFTDDHMSLQLEEALHRALQEPIVSGLLTNHTAPITSIAYSADDRYLATASRDGIVFVQDGISGKATFTRTGHVGTIWDVAFDPQNRFLATAGADGTVKLWNLVDEGKTDYTLKAHAGSVYSVAFSPDGRHLATAGADGTAKVWELTETGLPTETAILTLTGHTGTIWDIAFDPKGGRVATAGADRTAIVWDLSSGTVSLQLSGHIGIIYSVAFSADGKQLATASADGTARIWELATGQSMLIVSGHGAPVRDVDFSPDGTRFATASLDKTVRIWDALFGTELLPLSDYTDAVYAIAYNSDGTRLATGSADGTANVWTIAPGQRLLNLSGHTGFVYGVDFSPDGTHLTTGSADKTAKLWDLSSGEELLSLKDRDGVIWDVSFGPDGTEVATVGASKSAKVWNLRKPSVAPITLPAVFSPPRNAFWRADGSRLLSANADGSAQLWNVYSGEELLTLSGHTNEIIEATWNKDGTRILTAGKDRTARVWDAHTGEELLVLNKHKAWVVQAQWSHNEQLILTASRDWTARVWSAQSGEQMFSLEGHWLPLVAAAWSPDDSRILTAGQDGRVQVWDAVSGEHLRTLFVGYLIPFPIIDARWNGAGDRILTTSLDETARIWDVKSGSVLAALYDPTGSITHAQWSADESRVLTAGRNGTVGVWDAGSALQLFTLSGNPSPIAKVAWNADESHILAASEDGLLRVWDTTSREELLRLNVTERTGDLYSAAFNPDGTRFAISSADQRLRIWDLPTGQEFILSSPPDVMYGAAFHPDGTQVATASRDGMVKVWDIDFKRQQRLLPAHSDAIWDLTYSADGMHLATASVDRTVKVWDVASGYQQLLTLTHGAEVYTVAFSPDGNRLATGTREGAVTIWNMSTGSKELTWVGHNGTDRTVWDVRFSPDGNRLATSGDDGTVRMWDANLGTEKLVLSDHAGAVRGVAYSPDGKHLATVSMDKTIHVYTVDIEELMALARTRVTRSLTPQECLTYLHQEICPPAP